MVHTFVPSVMDPQHEKHSSLQQFEFVYVSDIAANGKCLMFCSEQKSIRWILDLLSNFFSPGDLLVDSCERLMAEARADMPLSQNQRFMGSEEDACFVKEALPGLAELCARHALRPESNKTVYREIYTPGRFFLPKRYGIQPGRKISFGADQFECCLNICLLAMYFILFHRTTTSFHSFEAVSLFTCTDGLLCSEAAFLQ